MPKKKDKKNGLKKSFIIFLIVAIISLIIVLSKGTIAGYRLVSIDDTAIAEKDEGTKGPKMEVTSEKKYISAESKDKTKLTVTIDGQDVTDTAELSSSDEKIVKIENAEARAVKTGLATITATKDNITATTSIRVIVPIKTLKLGCPFTSINVGETEKLQVDITPSDANIDTLVFSSVNESIATVDANAMITGIKKGVATFKVYDEYTGKESTVKVTIK